MARARTVFTAALAAVSLSAVLVGCSGREAPGPTSASVVTIRDANSAKSTGDTTDPLSYPAFSDPDTPIFVALGRSFAVMLEADPSGGYRWELTEEPDREVITPLGQQFLTQNTALPGSPDSELFIFAASGIGSAEIRLRYSAVGNTGTTEPEDVVFTVTVTEDGQPPTTEPEFEVDPRTGLTIPATTTTTTTY